MASTTLSLWGIASHAASITETTDVGELLNSAGLTDNQPAGTSLDSISSSLSTHGDIDLYQIMVSGGVFSATTTEAGSSPIPFKGSPIWGTIILGIGATLYQLKNKNKLGSIESK